MSRDETTSEAVLVARIRREWTLREAQRPGSEAWERFQRRLDALTTELFRLEQNQEALGGLNRRIGALQGGPAVTDSDVLNQQRGVGRVGALLGVAGVVELALAATLRAPWGLWALAVGTCLVSGLILGRVTRRRRRSWSQAAVNEAAVTELLGRRAGLLPRDLDEIVNAADQNVADLLIADHNLASEDPR